MALETSASTVMERCEILSRYSEETDCLTRRLATPAMQQVMETVQGWMQAAGMTVEYDCVGNIIGRYAARTAHAKTLLLGSHLDTVPDGGKYDGPLGVLIALACVECLFQRQERLPFAIEVLGFADEEGLRFHTAYIGSKAMTGTFDLDTLCFTDTDGITMAEALRAAGGNPAPEVLRRARWQRDELIGYCEVHIEQGPILEAHNLPVAIVSAIAGQSRFLVTFVGETGHAGTVPMALRHDALCAASAFVLAVEALALATPGLVATVGQISVQAGASNVIPREVTLSLDVRHQDDAIHEHACKQLFAQARQISTQRRISLHWQLIQEMQTIHCSRHLIQLLEQALEDVDYPVYTLPSRAGHDAVILNKLTDVAMLFVRCRGGISHHPAESVQEEDVAAAIQVLERFLHLQSRGEQA